MIRHSEARQIAEAMWGTGGTISCRTNRPGAFYFSCSGHGGYVIDAKAFTPDELAAIREVVKEGYPYKTYEWGDGRKSRRFLYPGQRRRNVWVAKGATETIGEYFLFEEDCDWAIVHVKTAIHRLDKPPSEELNRSALDTFNRYHATESAA